MKNHNPSITDRSMWEIWMDWTNAIDGIEPDGTMRISENPDITGEQLKNLIRANIDADAEIYVSVDELDNWINGDRNPFQILRVAGSEDFGWEIFYRDTRSDSETYKRAQDQYNTLVMLGDPFKSTIVSDYINENRLYEASPIEAVPIILDFMKKNNIRIPHSYSPHTTF